MVSADKPVACAETSLLPLRTVGDERRQQAGVKDSRRAANLSNKLLEFCDGLVQISSDAD